MNEKESALLKQAQLIIMDEIHRICIENNITYYIIGGTALGAKRHGGFIPWDIDIDIAMPRSDYDRFKRACDIQLNDKFRYKDFENTPAYNHPHAIVTMKNTKLIHKKMRYNNNEPEWEIYVDIFPLDNAPDDEKRRIKQDKTIQKNKKQIRLKSAYLYNDNLIKKVVKNAISIGMFWTDIDKLNRKFDKLIRQYNNDKTSCLCSMSSHYSYKKQCMEKAIYGTPQLVSFEDRQYYAPEQLEKYLTRIYGDYMKLPPKEEQEKYAGIFESVKVWDS